jgi:hypothetical protein
MGEGKSVANVCIGFLGLFLEWEFFFGCSCVGRMSGKMGVMEEFLISS